MNVLRCSEPFEAVERAYSIICDKGEEITVRGLKSRRVHNVAIVIKNTDGINSKEIISSKFRSTNVSYLKRELFWYLSARNDTDFIAKTAPFWKQITIDGRANSAYGFWLFRHENGVTINNRKVSQWDHVTKLLKDDPNTRKAVLYLGSAANYNAIDTICTNNIQFYIDSKNKLCMTVQMRSNDVVWGLTNDVALFSTLQKLMACRLGLELGDYTHLATDLHIYEKDYKSIDIYKNEDPRIKGDNIVAGRYDMIPDMLGDNTAPYYEYSERLYNTLSGLYNNDDPLMLLISKSYDPVGAPIWNSEK